MHYAVMGVVVTVRDVPEDVRDLLAGEAEQRGQSLQAYLLSVLRRQAAFSHNRQLLGGIEEQLSLDGGAGSDAPAAAELIRQGRAERDAGLGGR